MDSREALIALNMIEHVGPVRVRQLLEHFGEAPRILSASKHHLMHVRGIGEETADSIAGWEKSVDLAGELKRISDFGCHILISPDEEYPELLRQIYDPPIVLYVKGRLSAFDAKSDARSSLPSRRKLMTNAPWRCRCGSVREVLSIIGWLAAAIRPVGNL